MTTLDKDLHKLGIDIIHQEYMQLSPSKAQIALDKGELKPLMTKYNKHLTVKDLSIVMKYHDFFMYYINSTDMNLLGILNDIKYGYKYSQG